MKEFPAFFPDINLFNEADLPLTFEVPIRHNGRILNLTDLNISVSVTKNGTVIGTPTLDLERAQSGVATLTLGAELWDVMGVMATWWLREDDEFNCAIVRGRIVKL